MMRDEAIYCAMVAGLREPRDKSVSEFKRHLAASGYAVVPIRAAANMLDATGDVEMLTTFLGDPGANFSDGEGIWDAMLAAAQKGQG